MRLRRTSTTGLVRAALTGYALGAFPSADLASQLARRGSAVREQGSGNPGATNASTVLGPRWGALVLAADVAKGAIAAARGQSLAGDLGAHVGATAAVVGHCHPVWAGFRGGKGVATSAGQCLATFPAYFPIDLAVAYGALRWRSRANFAVAVSAGAWVTAALWWWRRRLPNLWGPKPGPALPAAAAVSSAVILNRFRQDRDRVEAARLAAARAVDGSQAP